MNHLATLRHSNLCERKEKKEKVVPVTFLLSHSRTSHVCTAWCCTCAVGLFATYKKYSRFFSAHRFTLEEKTCGKIQRRSCSLLKILTNFHRFLQTILRKMARHRQNGSKPQKMIGSTPLFSAGISETPHGTAHVFFNSKSIHNPVSHFRCSAVEFHHCSSLT
jgi:hypothetical protein